MRSTELLILQKILKSGVIVKKCVSCFILARGLDVHAFKFTIHTSLGQ